MIWPRSRVTVCFRHDKSVGDFMLSPPLFVSNYLRYSFMSTVFNKVSLRASHRATESVVATRWSSHRDEDSFVVMNPATAQAIATVHGSGRAEVVAAVKASSAAFEKNWHGRAFAERSQMLLAAAKTIREHADELAHLETSENGKVYTLARHVDLEGCISTFEFFGSISANSVPNSFVDGAHYYDQLLAEPYGVIAAIIPSNWPAQHLAAKLAPALLAGNTVVLKPCSAAPLTALRIIDLIAPIFPNGVVQIVLGEGGNVGQALVSHPEVRKITFTGSTPTGIAVLKSAAEHVTPTISMLSGKNAAIVFDDADENAAVRALLEGAFLNQGEARSATSLILVQRRVHDRVVAQLAKAIARLRVGNGFDPHTHIGPVISRARQQHILKCIDSAVAQGARIAAQARVPTSKPFSEGYFVPPTLLTNVTADMAVAREEIMGPVAAVMSFSTVEEAVAIVNSSEFGMLAVVFTQNHNLATRLSRRLDVGTVYLNNFQRLGLGMSFNGIKATGYGREERTLEVLREYTTRRLVRTATGTGNLSYWPVIDEILG
jgi:acyl-CoA reductase-like NAD-dependent aldehyde dehydrogenase